MTPPWSRAIGLLVVLALALWSAPARAGNPDLRWRTLESDHFYVHYYAGEEEAADRTLMVAERAYRNLSVAWGHRVFLKTHITLIDTTDVANGRATAVPFPAVTAHVVAPGALNVLEAYDDWIDILITHELVHIVHLDTVHGIPRLVNAVLGFGVLGKVSSPNILQPRWIVEGIATFEESDDTSGGRHQSAQFDMLLRMAVLEDQFQRIDQASNGARVYPHGTTVYLYGLHFMHYIASRYGADKLRELSHLYAGQLIPFGINRAIKKVLGVTFYRLWKDFKQDTERRFKAQARRMRARGLRQGRRLTFSGQTTRYPFWSNDDSHIYFYEDSGHIQSGIKRIRSTGGRLREGLGIGREGADLDVDRILDIEPSSRGSFVGAGGDIVFDMMANYDYRYTWNDLHRWKSGSDRRAMEQLTFGLRASEPDVSPDGRTVVFVRGDIAQKRLAFLELATGDVTEVAPVERLHQVYTPSWAPDGNRVAYSAFREGGFRDIYLYDREAGRTTRITADRHMDMAPTWTPDGRYVIFTSDRDNTYNLYAYDTEDGSLDQVTNVYGGAFESAVSHDGERIAYVGYSSTGYDLWVMELDPDRWLPVMPAQSKHPAMLDPKPPIAKFRGRPPALSSKRYMGIKTFFPRIIFPTALDFAAGGFGTTIGFETGIFDVLGFHSLLANFTYLAQEQEPLFAVSYDFNRLFPNFSFAVTRGYSENRGFTRYVFDPAESLDAPTYEVTGYRERATAVSGGMSVPIVRHPRHRAAASIGYRWTRWTNLDAEENGVDPNAPVTNLPEVGDASQVSIGLSYDNLESNRPFGWGSQTGRRVDITTSILDDRLGGDFNDIQTRLRFAQALKMPWRGQQSVIFNVEGGVSGGGLARRGSFCAGTFVRGDALRNVLNRLPFLRCSALLRGTEPAGFRGRYLFALGTDYRIPIVDVDRGIGSLPFFLRRIGLIPFVDWGRAWTDPVTVRDFALGVGALLLVTLRLGYAEDINVGFQYEHGFLNEESGIDVFRAVVTRAF